jgi:hypothetical protein
MPQPEKPRNRSGYSREETEQVVAACLTLAVTLGAYMDDIAIIGGLVPSLLIDIGRDGDHVDDDLHPGTNDLDVALTVALLDDGRYAEISQRLKQEDFGPDQTPDGNDVLQRWKAKDMNVTIDFLIAPVDEKMAPGRIHKLERDFGAVVAPGTELAFDERVIVELEGHTLAGEHATRSIGVCGPGAFVVLKALAFADRGERKDAYDLVYVIRGWPKGADDIVQRLVAHSQSHREIVVRALGFLARDFATIDEVGPQRAARFEIVEPASGDALDIAAADARGHVRDVLRGCARAGLIAEPN